MKSAPIPTNESERLAALHRYDLLGSPADRTFDDLAWLAAHICQTPIALVSLVELDRQCFAARVGVDVTHTSREASFCAHAILQSDLLVVPDALADARFADNPLVTAEPHIRFYAGAPLITPDGHALGTICAIDRVPRQLTPEQIEALRALSRLVVSRLELRLTLIEKLATETSLREVSGLQQAIFHGANYAIISTRVDGVIQTFSAAAERMFGYAAEEVVGRETPLSFTVASEIRARAEELSHELGRTVSPGFEVFVAKTAGGQPEEREWTCVHKDGSSFPVLASVTKLCDDKGQAIGFLGIVRDITERRRMMESLKESEARKSAILEAALDCIITMDEHGHIVEFNPAAEKTFGYRTADVVGHELGEKIIPPRLRESHRQGMRRFLATGEAHVQGRRIEVMAQRADGSEFPAELAINNICLGERRLFTAFLRDITERVSSEQRRAQKTAAIEAVDEGIAILDERGEFTYLNAAHLRIFGFENPDDLLGRTWQELYPPEEIARFAGEVFPLLEKEGRWRGEATACRQDGTTFAEEVSLTTLPDGGLICVCRDITARKQEQEFHHQAKAATDKANAELARANRLKDEFLANMSHELRTPLNAVLGMSEALQEKILGPLTDKQAKSLQVIHESGTHLLSLINDILDLSKIEAGRMELQREAVCVDSVCHASLRLLKEAAHRKHLNPQFNKADAVRFVFGDERRIKQILVNLLSNAVKFTPVGGAVGLDVAPAADGEIVEFTVWDDGIGIAEEDLAKLFKPFVQLDSGLARQHEGTGLGLALIWKLAELHDGGVRVESRPGYGSRFTVSLPAHNGVGAVSETEPPASASANTASPATTGGSPATLLLAEDNDANALTFTTYLEGHGYRVAHARNGLEAVAFAKSYRPAVILMDVQMPVMDGLEATRRIRADTELKHTPIIALTALAMPGDRERCLAAGADDYLAKPVNMKSLAQKLQERIQQRRQA